MSHPNTFASASADGSVIIWDKDNGTILKQLKNAHSSKSVYTCTYTNDDNVLVSGGRDGKVQLWRCSDWSKLNSQMFPTSASYVFRCRGSPVDTSVFAVAFGNPNQVQVFRTDGTQVTPAMQEGHTKQITSCEFSRDGKRIITCSFDSTVKLWDVQASRLLLTFAEHKKYSYVMGGVFNDDGSCVASGGSDNTVRLWHSESGKTMHTIDVKSSVYSCDMRGHQLLVGMFDGTLQVFDTRKLVTKKHSSTTDALLSLEGHTSVVRAKFVGKEEVISCSEDKTINLWNLHDNDSQLVRTFSGHTHSVYDIAMPVGSILNNNNTGITTITTTHNSEVEQIRKTYSERLAATEVEHKRLLEEEELRRQQISLSLQQMNKRLEDEKTKNTRLEEEIIKLQQILKEKKEDRNKEEMVTSLLAVQLAHIRQTHKEATAEKEKLLAMLSNTPEHQQNVRESLEMMMETLEAVEMGQMKTVAILKAQLEEEQEIDNNNNNDELQQRLQRQQHQDKEQHGQRHDQVGESNNNNNNNNNALAELVQEELVRMRQQLANNNNVTKLEQELERLRKENKELKNVKNKMKAEHSLEVKQLQAEIKKIENKFEEKKVENKPKQRQQPPQPQQHRQPAKQPPASSSLSMRDKLKLFEQSSSSSPTTTTTTSTTTTGISTTMPAVASPSPLPTTSNVRTPSPSSNQGANPMKFTETLAKTAESIKEVRNNVAQVNTNMITRMENMNSNMNDRMEQVNTNVNDRMEQVNTNVNDRMEKMNDRIEQVNTNVSTRMDQMNTNMNNRMDQMNTQMELLMKQK